MPTNLNIVLIDLDESSRQHFMELIKEIPDVTLHSDVKNFDKGFDLIDQDHPDIVILNLHPTEEKAFNLVKKITKSYPQISIFLTAKEADTKTVIRAMRMGAREFIVQPFEKEELFAAISRVREIQQDSIEGKISKGKVISFYGVKGGVGTSIIATNVATSLSRYLKKDVIIIDLNLQFGNVALLLDIKPKYSILDVAKNIENIDVDLLKTKLPKSASGISLLAPPKQIEETEAVQSTHIEQVLTLLRTLFDFIIVDASRDLNDIIIKSLDKSDIIITVTSLDVLSILNTKRCLALFNKLHYPKDKVLLVVNRYKQYENIDIPAMEKLLNYPIFWRLPNQEFKNVLASINKGVPISELMPNSKLSQNFLKMVEYFNGRLTIKDESKDKEKKTSFIKRILK
jgi:pilus assembly protein CpaE